jgi:spore germination cell wall hydrolase CwlJ-like protein
MYSPLDHDTPTLTERRGGGGLFFTEEPGCTEPLTAGDASEEKTVELPNGHRNARAKLTILILLAGLGLLLASFAWKVYSPNKSRLGSSVTFQVPPVQLPPPNLFRPISPDEAVKENAERPFVSRPDVPARGFVLHTDAADKERAITCLTQAIYYEAGGEGVDGGRAVAQVVLNRMRHPGFPASVCGVIYQGVEKGSGCQFTFVCDGSLLRPPVPSLWERAKKIAEQALSGHVFAPIGHATHYHADYVLPYWADSLDKSVQIGRHIFYRLPSVLGDSRSFFQHYSGKEPEIPKPASTVILPTSPTTQQMANALIADQSNGPAKDVEKAASPKTQLAIDSSHGTLIADGIAAPVGEHHEKAASECVAASDHKQVIAIRAEDLRAGLTSFAC